MPEQMFRAGANTAAGEVVLPDLNDELRLERCHSPELFGCPAARAARLVAREPAGAISSLRCLVRAGFPMALVVDVKPARLSRAA